MSLAQYLLLPEDLSATADAGAIAVLAGRVSGAALERALAAPLRIAMPDAVLDRGAGEDICGWAPIEAAAPGSARRWMLAGGGPLPAAAALELGLVDVVTDAPAGESVRQWSAERSSLARRTLAKLLPAARMGTAALDARERSAFALLFALEDPREGITAFLEDRPPVFAP